MKLGIVLSPYRFTQWDGGLMLRGTTLGPNGMLGFTIMAVVLGAIATYQLARWSAL
jgi:hypothetical protein